MSTNAGWSEDENGPAWIPTREVARRLGTHSRTVGRLEKAGYLTVRRLPGADPLYCARDVALLAERSTRSADALARWAPAATG